MKGADSMELEAMGSLLESVPGFERRVAYDNFPKGKFPGLPVLRYRVIDYDTTCADNRVYVNYPVLSIELYTENKDIAAEKLVEYALDSAGLLYGKDEESIDGEQCYVVSYTVCI